MRKNAIVGMLVLLSTTIPNSFAQQAPVASLRESVSKPHVLQVEAVLTMAEPVEIPARENGVLTELLVEEGQRVESGAVLAKIDDKQARFDRTRTVLELEAAKREAENDASVQVAEKAHELAVQEYQRAQRLNRDRPGTLSAEELEERRLRADAARLEIDNAKNKLEVARTTQMLKSNEVEAADYRIERRTIITLVSGFVERTEAQLGEWVEPGATVFRIVRDDRLFAEAFVPASQVRGDLTGHTVRVVARTVDGKQSQLTGVITYFSPHVGTLDGEVRVRAELTKESGLIASGQKVTMAIELDAQPVTVRKRVEGEHAASVD